MISSINLLVLNQLPVKKEAVLWPYRLTVRTDPFHGSNWGSIPHRVTKIYLIIKHSRRI